MKKFKKIVKEHYKRIITVFCVVISLIAFSINSFADETNYGDPNVLGSMQIQKLKGNNSGTITVRGTFPMGSTANPSYQSNINLKQSAVFAFDTNYETIVFSWSDYEHIFVPEKNGYVYFNFEFLFAGNSLKYDSVAGFKSSVQFTNGNSDYESFDYSNVNVTVSNGTYPGLGYSSYVFNISGYFYVQSGYLYHDIQLALKFSSKEPTSNTSFLIRKFKGFMFYDNINDIPQHYQQPDEFEKVEIEDEKELTDNIVTDTEEGLDTFTEVVGGWRTQWGTIDDLSVCSVIWAQFLELRHISRILYLSLAIGAFALVFNLFNMSSRLGGK